MANNNMLRANQAARANNNRPMISPAVYGECIRSRLTGAMTYDTDGCLAFAPGGPPGSTEALCCQTCGCSRSFHRRLDTSNLLPVASHQIYDDTRLVYSPPVFTAPSSTIIPPPPPPPRTQPDAPAADVNMEFSNANANSLAESFRVTAVENISTGSVNLQCVHSPVSATRGSVKGKEVMDAEIAKTFAKLPPLPPRQQRSKSPAVSGKRKSTVSSSDVVSEIMKDKVWLLTEELEWLNMKNKEEEDKKNNNKQLEETNSNEARRKPIVDHTIDRLMSNRAEVLKTMNHQFLVIATTLTARRELGDQSPCSGTSNSTESENDESSSDSDSDS